MTGGVGEGASLAEQQEPEKQEALFYHLESCTENHSLVSAAISVRIMGSYEISMYENENFPPKFSWLNIPWMMLCTAQRPVKISEATKSCQGRNFHFHA